MDLGLAGKRALVTGSSRGIGAGVAAELAREGVDLCLVARSADDLATVAGTIAAESGRRVVTHLADLREADAAAQAVAAATDALGGLDLLVNVAGATKRGDFFELTDADWADGYALKLHGAVRMCRSAWPHLVAAQGSIVNIIGIGSRRASADFTIGGSVNSALLNFTKALADRASGTGVRVNAINPGVTETTRLTKRLDKATIEGNLAPGVLAAERLRTVPMGRFGRPEEIGWMVAYLASPRAAFMHGAIVDIDGGETRCL